MAVLVEARSAVFVATIEGLYCYDPRLDSTYPGGDGDCRLDDPDTWVWTRNPILFALKWALGLWEGPTGKGAPQVDYQVGGIGAKVESIRLSTVVAAANQSDANGWTSAAWPSTDDDKAQVLDGFLKAGGARYAEIAGQMAFIHRAAPRTPVFTVTARDTCGPVEIDTTSSKLNRINTIRPRFWSEANEWEMAALPEVTATAWQEEDGQGVAVQRTRGVDYTFVDQDVQAAQLASLEISNSREGIKGRVPLRLYMDPEPGNCFIFDEPEFALADLKCFVLDVEDDTENDQVIVTFESETDGKYPFAYGQTTEPPPPQELSPVDPTYVSPPEAGDWTLSAETITDGGVSLPILAVTGSCENATADSVIFEFRPSGVGADWAGAGLEGPTVIRKEIGGPITPGTSYEVAVRYRRGNNVSDPLELAPVVATDVVVPGEVNVENDGRRIVVQSTNDVLLWVGSDAVDPLFADTSNAEVAIGSDGRLWREGVPQDELYSEPFNSAPVSVSGALSDIATFILGRSVADTNIFNVSMGLTISAPTPRTRSSSTTVAPTGTWEIWELPASGTVNQRKVASGTWSSSIIGAGPNAAYVESFDIDGAGDHWSDVSRQWRFRHGGLERFVVKMSATGADLLDLIVNLRASIQKFD